MMLISMILDHEACISDAANFVTDERTDEQGDSRSWMLAVQGSKVIGILQLYGEHTLCVFFGFNCVLIWFVLRNV